MTPTVHTPRYLLRRATILQMLRHYRTGEFLEIGCGRGELLPWLARLGFTGTCLEISDEVRPIAEEAAAHHPDSLTVVGTADQIGDHEFDYLMAFEVLEHIEDDTAALRSWVRWLHPEGRFFISVPAKHRYWSASDEAVGHFRRYERDTMRELLAAAGLEAERWWSYGYPLVIVTKPLRDLMHRRQLADLHDKSKEQRTLASSLDSTLRLQRYGAVAALLTRAMASAGRISQRPFRNSDRGDGYLVACKLVPGSS